MSDTTKRAPTPARTTRPDPRAIWRQETARAAREIHERAYLAGVAIPLEVEGYPRPRAQVMLIPGRRYRFDFAYLEARLAVEVSGQIWHKGAHTSGRGVTRDAAKANELACIGWRLLVFTPEMIADGTARDFTRRALRHAGLRGAA